VILPREFVERVRVQPNPYTCAPAALRYALLWHGERISLERVVKAARVSKKHGADEFKLAKAARRFGYEMTHHRRDNAPMIVKANLRWWSSLRVPVLTCVDQDSEGKWAHWITMINATARAVTFCDPARPGPVIRVVTWREFLGRACAWYPGVARFDIYPVRAT
jgi:ABC-type bacteriocin/lantibiotic exporter with double-glycine peptidase domain